MKEPVSDLIKSDRQKLHAPPATKADKWNSVRVTFRLPSEVASKLRSMANETPTALRTIGVQSLQVDNTDNVSLTLATSMLTNAHNPAHMVAQSPHFSHGGSLASTSNVPPATIDAVKRSVMDILQQNQQQLSPSESAASKRLVIASQPQYTPQPQPPPHVVYNRHNVPNPSMPVPLQPSAYDPAARPQMLHTPHAYQNMQPQQNYPPAMMPQPPQQRHSPSALMMNSYPPPTGASMPPPHYYGPAMVQQGYGNLSPGAVNAGAYYGNMPMRPPNGPPPTYAQSAPGAHAANYFGAPRHPGITSQSPLLVNLLQQANAQSPPAGPAGAPQQGGLHMMPQPPPSQYSAPPMNMYLGANVPINDNGTAVQGRPDMQPPQVPPVEGKQKKPRKPRAKKNKAGQDQEALPSAPLHSQDAQALYMEQQMGWAPMMPPYGVQPPPTQQQSQQRLASPAVPLAASYGSAQQPHTSSPGTVHVRSTAAAGGSPASVAKPPGSAASVRAEFGSDIQAVMRDCYADSAIKSAVDDVLSCLKADRDKRAEQAANQPAYVPPPPPPPQREPISSSIDTILHSVAHSGISDGRAVEVAAAAEDCSEPSGFLAEEFLVGASDSNSWQSRSSGQHDVEFFGSERDQVETSEPITEVRDSVEGICTSEVTTATVTENNAVVHSADLLRARDVITTPPPSSLSAMVNSHYAPSFKCNDMTPTTGGAPCLSSNSSSPVVLDHNGASGGENAPRLTGGDQQNRAEKLTMNIMSNPTVLAQFAQLESAEYPFPQLPPSLPHEIFEKLKSNGRSTVEKKFPERVLDIVKGGGGSVAVNGYMHQPPSRDGNEPPVRRVGIKNLVVSVTPARLPPQQNGTSVLRTSVDLGNLGEPPRMTLSVQIPSQDSGGSSSSSGDAEGFLKPSPVTSRSSVSSGHSSVLFGDSELLPAPQSKRRRRASGSSVESTDSNASAGARSRRKCAENTAELIKHSLGVHDAPRRLSRDGSTKSREASAEPAEVQSGGVPNDGLLTRASCDGPTADSHCSVSNKTRLSARSQRETKDKSGARKRR